MIGWLMRREIEPHIPLLDREHQTNGFFTRSDFTFDPQANLFICPGGKQLKSTGLVRDDGTVPYLRAPRIAAPTLSGPTVPTEPNGSLPATCSRPNASMCVG